MMQQLTVCCSSSESVLSRRCFFFAGEGIFLNVRRSAQECSKCARFFFKTLAVSHMADSDGSARRSGATSPHAAALHHNRAPRVAIDAATQAFAAPAAPDFDVQFAPVPAVYAAPAPVIEYMAPALELADRHGPKVPFVQGEQVPKAQSFENIVGSSEFWSAQDTETWLLFLSFRGRRCQAWRWVHLTMPIWCLRCLWPRPWSTSLPSLISVVECVQHGPVIDFAVSAPAVVPAALAPVVEFVTNVKGTQRIQFDSSLVF